MKKKPKLNLEERERLFGWLHEGKSVREIARLLDRNHSSIAREVKRNRNQNTGEYLPCTAQKKAEKRELKQRSKAPLKDSEIFLYVRRKLRMGWSPEVIAGKLRLDKPGKKICVESIYQYIYATKKHPHEDLTEYLVLHRKKRMKVKGRKVHKTKIPGRIGIELRPIHIEQRDEYGHGETDFMEGLRSDKKVLSVTLERKTRYARLTLLEAKTARSKAAAVRRDQAILKLKTATTDNGSENTSHQSWKVPTYFTTPYHSWEKGGVENIIGRTRRYIPKKHSLDSITVDEVKYIEWEMNHTPRKCLNFLTPAEALAKELNNPIF